MEPVYILWACPKCRKLMGLERSAPKNLRYCTTGKERIICDQEMPTQEERDNFMECGSWNPDGWKVEK